MTLSSPSRNRTNAKSSPPESKAIHGDPYGDGVPGMATAVPAPGVASRKNAWEAAADTATETSPGATLCGRAELPFAVWKPGMGRVDPSEGWYSSARPASRS